MDFRMRLFVVDFTDINGKDFYKEFYVPEFGTVIEDFMLIMGLTEQIRMNDGEDCVITSITEILDHTYEELKEIVDAGQVLDKKYIKMLYVNSGAIRKSMAN